jgi:phosphoribosylformylglycinamidine cyclo-ligase
VLDLASYQRPALFDWLQRSGNVDSREMHRVFNCGIGMVVCVPAAQAEQAVALLQAEGESASVIGSIEPLAAGAERIQLQGL